MGTINASTLKQTPIYSDLKIIHATPSTSFVALADKTGINWAKTHGGELPSGSTGPFGRYFDYVRSHLADDVRTTGNDVRFAHYHPVIATAVESDFYARLESPPSPRSPAPVLPGSPLAYAPVPTIFISPTAPTAPCGTVPEPSSGNLLAVALFFSFTCIATKLFSSLLKC